MVRIVKIRRDVWDRQKRDWVPQMLPTDTIKAARQVTGAHAATAMYRRTVGAGTALRITFQAFGRRGGTPLGASGKFFMVDREGTFDFPYVEADGREVVLGGPEAPVHSVEGSFRVFVGSVAGGSFWFAYEGVIDRGGTETVTA